MTRGRKPEPTALKLLRGNTGHRPMPDPEKEPKPDPTCPKCPTWLNKVAKAKWKEIVPQLHKMGVVTRIDRDILTLYCETWSQLREATDRRADKEVGFAWQAECRHLKAQIHKYKAELGMTPSSRTRLSVSKPETTGNPFKDLLARKRKAE